MSIYSLKYIIRKDRENSQGTCPIYLRYSCYREYKDIPLGVSVSLKLKHFIEENGTISPKCPNFQVIVKKMIDLDNEVKNVINLFYYEKNEYPRKDEILHLLKSNRNLKIVKLPKTLDELYNEFITDKTNKFIKKSTLDTYNQFWTKWKEFEEESSKKFTIDDLHSGTFNNFDTYLINNEFQKSYIGKIYKTMKTFLNYVKDIIKVPISDDFKKVKVHKPKVDFVVLTELELEKLSSIVLYGDYENIDKINLTERQRLIGRIFLFLCCSGLSYVDFNRLTIDNIFFGIDNHNKPKVEIKITRQKLNSTIDCVIPILSRTIDLLFLMIGYHYFKKDYDQNKPFYETIEDDKVDLLRGSVRSIKKEERTEKKNRIFPYVPDTKFNEEIKDVLKIIGIDERVKINKLVKNKQIEIFDYKYNLVSSHTGRRTYITWCINNGIDRSTIMKTTGHTSIKTLQDYTRKDDSSVHNEFYDKIKENKERMRKILKDKVVDKDKDE
jgi:integrase